MICQLDNSWEKLVDDIYNASKSSLSKFNVPVQGKIDLPPCSNSDRTVNGKIQLKSK